MTEQGKSSKTLGQATLDQATSVFASPETIGPLEAMARWVLAEMMAYRRVSFLALGWLCVMLGAIGVVLPVMPTTIFLLIALWAFAKSSPRLHSWLLENPYYGPYIRDWQAHRIIPLRAKCTALAMMGASLGILFWGTATPLPVTASVAMVLFPVSIFIVTQKSRLG